MQGDEIFFVDQNLGNQNDNNLTAHKLSLQFQEFLKEWHVENSFVYREQLLHNGELENYYIKINFEDIETFDLKLSMELRSKPMYHLPLLEEAVNKLYGSININKTIDELPKFQVQIVSGENPKKIRDLKSEDIGNLTKIDGIVINAGEVLIKGKEVVLECKSCGHQKHLILEHGISGIIAPSKCENSNSNRNPGTDRCAYSPYKINDLNSKFIDYQVLKIQENGKDIPTGEIPRTYKIIAERYLCDRLIPGNKVSLTGVYTIKEQNFARKSAKLAGLKVPYIYLLGFENLTGGGRDFNPNYTNEEKERFKSMSEDPEIYEKITKSIGVNIFGNNSIKSAISCLLFGGSSKKLPDKTNLRGDINVLLIGDPSTAKSQFLKFVHKIAPVSVYTSGKGSSAAGLTATIIRDPATKQFHLEGGALVLADGGVVCIDEFDKMRTQDRIAIHEAMEQQTISIAKAGITTILNSRTSILAAANPTMGSYVSYKSRSEQIDLQTTILSRFDCIFTVIDRRDRENDRKIARHIINLHIQKDNSSLPTEIDLGILKKYIAFARATCFPRLTSESAEVLQNLFLQHRSKVKHLKKKNKKHIPITVRQLEAIIRLSESIAKMRLAKTVTKKDVEIANKIFEISTMDSLKSGVKSLIYDPNRKNNIIKIEEHIRSILPINNKISIGDLEEDLEMVFGDLDAISDAIGIMIGKGELQEMQNSIIKRRK